MCIYILQVQDIVDDYKNANLTISKNCKKISEMLLVKIDGKRVYDNLEFEEEQVNLDVIRRLLSYLSWWVFESVRWGSKSISTSIVSWSHLPLVGRLSVHQSICLPTCSSVSRSNAINRTINQSNNRSVKIIRPSNRYGAFSD